MFMMTEVSLKFKICVFHPEDCQGTGGGVPGTFLLLAILS